MLVSKEKFLYYLSKYKQADEERDRFNKALNPFFDIPSCNYLISLMDAYEELLCEISECSDSEDGIFSWWLDEHIDKTITVQDVHAGEKTTFDVATPEVLYDYLCYMYHHDD
jgi:hypothetical protein